MLGLYLQSKALITSNLATCNNSVKGVVVSADWLSVTEGHIRPFCQLPASQTSGLPLLGQNTVNTGTVVFAAPGK